MSSFWVDIDSPPQAQYLGPIAAALRAQGHCVLLTARDHRATLDVLANRGESAIPVGGSSSDRHAPTRLSGRCAGPYGFASWW